MKEETTLTFRQMMLDARDARLTSKSTQALLFALVMRCDPQEGYSCYPSYDLLSLDTGLDLKTLKRAAVELESDPMILVKREVRPNHSNLWFVNMRKLQTVADANRADWKKDKAAAATSPFELPLVVSKTDRDTPKGSAVNASRDHHTQNEPEGVEQVMTLLCEMFGGHPTLESAGAEKFLTKDVAAMIDEAGSAERLAEFLGSLDGKARASIKTSKRLGSYLRKCLTSWLGDAALDTYPVCRSIDAVVGIIDEIREQVSPDCPTVLGDAEVWESIQTIVRHGVSTVRLGAVLNEVYHRHDDTPLAGLSSCGEFAALIRENYESWPEWAGPEFGTPGSYVEIQSEPDEEMAEL